MTLVERAHVESFRALITRRFGLNYDDGKLDFLADVLRQRLEAQGLVQADAYLDRLAAPSRDEKEHRALAEQLTVAETFFFRNADHFRALREVVLPERIRMRSAEKRLRILSAGCASGEEPYSLAIVVREMLPDFDAWDIQIIGLDLNPANLAKATQGRYSAWSLRATPDEARARYFRQEGRDFILDPAIRRMVRFEERNLSVDDQTFWQGLGCDLVFCRNVLMYFTPDVMQRVVGRLSQALLTDGHLFLGHAETLRGVSHGYHLCHTHETFYYRKRDPTAAEGDGAPPTTFRSQVAEALPTTVADDGSWVDIIQRATDRIHALLVYRTQADASTPLAVAPPVTRSWDLGLALEHMRQERFAEALELVQALPPDSLDDPDALLIRAVLLTNIGRLEEAEAVCRRLLSLDNLNAGAHYVMALCREHAGDPRGAVEYDLTAVYLDAGFAMPRLHLGLLARRSHDTATAQRELNQALTLLVREDAARLLLFGGGFSREMLMMLCRTELRALGDNR